MQIDEYAGQETLDLAREALHGIVQLLVPDMGLPDSYLRLRGLDVPAPPDFSDFGR